MSVAFQGRWRGVVTGRNAGFSQRVVVAGAIAGNGTYNGVVGTTFTFEDGSVRLQWNDGAGSGWQDSEVTVAVGMSSPLVVRRVLSADDNVASKRDGDYDDLVVNFESLDPPFEVLQRPFALERGSRTMMPDGIFDTSQGVQYMGVRIRNTWFYDWQSAFPATGMKIGIAPASRSALAGEGITVIDSWSSAEQAALGQRVAGGYVSVPDLMIGEETMVYFKVNVTNARASKPLVGFVAQREAYDPNFDAPSRVVSRQVFLSESSYDHATRELVTAVPEGTLRLRLTEIVIDRKAANDAAKALIKCLHRFGDGKGDGSRDGGDSSSWWRDPAKKDRWCEERGSAALRELLHQVLGGKTAVDICRIRDLLDHCCETTKGCECGGHSGGGGGGPAGGASDGGEGGGWQEGTGMDGWCRVKPVAWLPIRFEYRIEPNPAYTGQFGPLAFEDPWWKVVLIVLAILLALASLVYDYVFAGQDPRFIIGRILRNGDAATNLIDAAVCDLNGSRGVNFGLLDAQSDDVNNGSPIVATDSILELDRTDNGAFGTEPAVIGNTVWKSGGTSATTRGSVAATNYTTTITYEEDTLSGEITFTDQVLVEQVVGMEQPLSQGGDSGSVWVDMASRRPVALNFAGPKDDSGTHGVGNPIRRVVDLLDIRFNSV